MNNNGIHKTSANMDGDVFDNISDVSANFNISENTIFKDLIGLLINASKCELPIIRLTEYQDHSPERWETFYYSLDNDELEIFSKARQKYKISISKIAFIAFVLFWEELIFIYTERLSKSKEIFFFNSYVEFLEKKKYMKKNLKKE